MSWPQVLSSDEKKETTRDILACCGCAQTLFGCKTRYLIFVASPACIRNGYPYVWILEKAVQYGLLAQ